MNLQLALLIITISCCLISVISGYILTSNMTKQLELCHARIQRTSRSLDEI